MFPDALRLAQFQDRLGDDLLALAPELVLCGAIVLLLVARLVPALTRVHLGPVAAAAAGVALAVAVVQWLAYSDGLVGGESFTGLVTFDPFAGFLRCFLLLFAVLVLLLTRLTGIPDAEDAADFGVLILGGILGMMLMVSANHLLMVFLAVEMASLPSYALSGFLKGRAKGSEAALKYVVYGAAASGVMLYGISLLAGRFGTGHLPTLAVGYAGVLRGGGFDLPLAAGTLFLFAGFAFKLAAVPFHFWLPDVFEGAAAEIGALLSVASKAAAVGLTARVLLALQAAVGQDDPTLLPRTLGLVLAVVAALTATLGNLAAFGQSNLKRLFAYSTVAHAGYMLMALAAMTPGATAAVLFYLVAYLLMNLGAFAVVAVVRNRTGSEELSAIRGLIARSPAVGVALAVFLLSLLGIPPLAGFAGKFQVFEAVYHAGRDFTRLGQPALAAVFYALLGVGVVNTVVSAGYYLRVLRAAGLDDAEQKDEKGEPVPLGASAAAGLYLGLLAVLLLVVGVAWNPVTAAAATAVSGFRVGP
jgi:NADH-quinone oxidoreductase subunit N